MKRLGFLLLGVMASMLANAQTIQLGTSSSPEGQTWTVDATSLMHNGKRVIPVMGEIHYTRVPESQWRTELLKMKAGGINAIATYVFWIHHEEIEGQYDWSGNRHLRKFVTLCKELGLPVILRMGPFCHGEVRNGGFPEWVIDKKYKIRTDDPQYLELAEQWYRQIYAQVQGLLFKDNGPIIGIQLENEYSGTWQHLMNLKRIAVKIGFDLPIYTRTGWPKLKTPAQYGEILPLYGDYSDGFWNRELTDMPGDYSNCYFFKSYQGSTVIATEQIKNQSEDDSKGELGYPFLTCELGGGMTPSYHRRVYIYPKDIYATALVKVGNGSNLPGYYMYHGGTNPEGKQTTLNEMQRTKVTNYNDLPMKSYDFQAPIGEFGQLNEQYHLLRNLHTFLNDFGSDLATCTPVFPVEETNDYNWDKSLRWNYRTDGHGGFVFVNNYQRMKTLSDKKDIAFCVTADGKEMTIPSKKVTVASGECFFFPFNMSVGGFNIQYVMAQPISKIEVNGVTTIFLKRINGITPEIAYSKTIKNLQHGLNKISRDIQIYLVDENEAMNLWKADWAGRERIFMTEGSLVTDGNSISIEDNISDFNVRVYPAPECVSYDGIIMMTKKEGLFTRYHIASGLKTKEELDIKKMKQEGALRDITIGINKAAEEPADKDFDNAAVWHITLPEVTNANQRALLKVDYQGDVARIYDGQQFADDNFYNGRPFLYDLCRITRPDSVTLKILPLQKNAPIYIQKEFQFGEGIKNVKASIVYLNTVKLSVMAPKSISFAKGADISWTTEMERNGDKFYNKDGQERECTQLMKELGMNTIRLRVWVNPKGYYSCKEDMLELAKRADRLGMAVMVDFHYSDGWADPSHQIIPEAWKDYDYSQMKEAVAAHSKEVMQLLKVNGIYPTYVQIGNETTHGFMWDMGENHKHMDQYVGLTNAGYEAVKSIFPRTTCIVHLDNGFDKDLYTRVFDGMKQFKGKYDMIGMSLYPYWAAMTDSTLTAGIVLKRCMNNIRYLYKRYGKECMIVETGTEDEKPNESKKFLSDLIQTAKANEHCKGVLYWEPECDKHNGYVLGSFMNGRPTIALDAFK